ncbi:MAG: phosphoribosyl-ATP diphosphatase [Coriobacteriales bacterium]|jgi:phosphoribosyl-ATP pyrophosphohydrolase|nr:phosphoribosyl-ATP diphosphatase [Coriobacteriales bacterium]
MGERTPDVRPGDIGVTITRLASVIRQRHEELPEGSYTAKLLAAGPDAALKKLGEETVELALAVKDGDHDHIRYEAADIVYHLLVALEHAGVGVEELAGELDARGV